MTVVTLSKEVQFDLGHRVPDHGSKCRNPHGHRYRVVAVCSGEVVNDPGSPDDGMVVDFGDLKAWLTEKVHDVLDHGFMVKTGDPLGPAMLAVLPEARIIEVPFSPTAENLAMWCVEQLRPIIDAHWRGNVTLQRVDVWETPTSLASATA